MTKYYNKTAYKKSNLGDRNQNHIFNTERVPIINTTTIDS